MTDLNQAIAAVLSAFAGLKAGDRITAEGHEAVFVLSGTLDRAVKGEACRVYDTDCLWKIDAIRYQYLTRPDYHLISPELDEALKELEKARK